MQFKKSKLTITLLVLIGFLLIAGLCAFQINKINSLNQDIAVLNNQITALNKTQLPQKKYASYEDCVNNGGLSLYTINVQFDGCLGGDMHEYGDLPMYQAFMQYSAQNLPRLSDPSKFYEEGENVILSGATASSDLTSFLLKSAEGCEMVSGDEAKFAPAYFKVSKEVNNRFALVKFGCENNETLETTYALAIKLADGWRWISTTNSMNEKGIPSCLVVDMFKVSKDLSPKCFENTGYNNDSLKNVTYP